MAQDSSNCSGSCSSCGVSNCGDRTAEGPEYTPLNEVSSISNVIAVYSGKGGVGKSLVTSLLACELQKRGYKVGILDADVTGPSIPRVLGITGRPGVTDTGIDPVESEGGIKVVSVNLMLPTEDTPVAWRGPVITSVLDQFWGETNWGELDVLLVDMPPGTSDVALTVFRHLPVTGIITVSAPQELVSMIVGKAVKLAGNMGVEVLGLVENMAYYTCKDCGEKQFIFGQPQGEEVAEKYAIPAYASLPLDPEFAQMCDAGKIADYDVKGALNPVMDAMIAKF